jgi:hypothetical protein
MKLRSLLVFCIYAFTLSASVRETRLMRVTAIEYREKDTVTPYRVEGQTVPPQTILYYVLDCKKGAADLHVGNSYQAAETIDNEGMKALLIYYGNPDDPITQPTIIGVTCAIESVKAKQ